MFSNCYKEGYDTGVKDAIANKSKSFNGVPKVKALLSGRCVETYLKGYSEGYRRGIAKKNKV